MYEDIVFNYKYYIVDTIIAGVPIQYSFHDRDKMNNYIGFLHDRVSELHCTFEYEIKETSSMDIGH